MFIHLDPETGIQTSENLKFDDAMRLLGTAALALMDGLDNYIKEKDPDNYDEVHGHIYDTFNILASNVLDAFDNTRSPGTDLTAQAILEAENAILDREVPTIEPTPDTTVEEETDGPA
jgi:hypothetical protein